MNNLIFDNYYFGNQIKKYTLQVMSVFSNMHVKVGKNGNYDAERQTDLVRVPVRHMPTNRVAEAILSENTQNRPVRLPLIAVRLNRIDLAPDRRAGIGAVSRDVTLPRGGTFPDDLKNIERYQPVPYKGLYEVYIAASNMDQMNQILEQILVIFDPLLQIQTSDSFNDMTRISTIELLSINDESPSPIGEDVPIVAKSLDFEVMMYLSLPANIKQNIVNSIKLRIDAISTIADPDVEVLDMDGVDVTNLIDVKELDPPKH